eukprot:15475517-Alexandrium_andersonii.AAC.1
MRILRCESVPLLEFGFSARVYCYASIRCGARDAPPSSVALHPFARWATRTGRSPWSRLTLRRWRASERGRPA